MKVNNLTALIRAKKLPGGLLSGLLACVPPQKPEPYGLLPSELFLAAMHKPAGEPNMLPNLLLFHREQSGFPNFQPILDE